MCGEELDLLGDELFAQVTVVDLEVVGRVVPDRGARSGGGGAGYPRRIDEVLVVADADQ
jgi:hypothetical protein